MAIAKRLWCKRLLEYFCLVQVLGMTCLGYEVSKFCCRGVQKSKPVKSRVANFSRKEGALLLGFSGCGKKQVMNGM